MKPITILHLSDLHWSKQKANDQRIVIDALIEDLRRLRADGIVPDLTLFSGDLVQAGDDPSNFASVKSHFIDRIVNELKPVPFIICPGNHDIQRDIVRASGGYIEAGLKAKLNSVDAVNKFIDEIVEEKESTSHAIARMQNYDSAFAHSDNIEPIIDTSLLRTYKLEVNDYVIGIATLNTAWRATGEPENLDRGALLMGERHVDIAIESLSDCDYRVAVFHHPLEWLSEFDNVAVASRLYAEFDVLAYGHSHRSEPEAKITAIGSAILSQSGCLYEHRDYFNGYQVLQIRPADDQVDFYIRTYFNRPRRAFDKAINIAPEGKLTLPYKGRTRPTNEPVEAFLRVTRPVVRQAAADQVNIVEAVNDLRLDPKEAFICPPLTIHRRSNVSDGANRPSEDQISAEELLRGEDNYLVVGARESGKSTLAHYLAVLAAEGAIDRPRIPAVLDYRELKLTAYGLSRAIATYYGVSKQSLDIDERLNAGDFIIIMDNFSGREKAARDAINELIGKYPGCRWILLADAKQGNGHVEEDEADLLSGFRAVHMQSLPRKSIRELSRRWCEPIGIDNQKAFSAVMAQLRDGNLPRTGYMVTLLLWALYQEKQFERINEALLLTYVIDHLLGKADFTQALEGSFDPTSKEITLQHLAAYLRSSDGIAQKNDVLQELISFFKQKGLQYDAAEIFKLLVDCGLLSDNRGVVAFKYRCFEEYFYAGLLRNDPSKLADALSNRAFVDFARELELLSGLRRQNKDILEVLQKEITAGMPPELKRFDPANFDKLASAEMGGGLSPRRLEDIRKKKLTADQIDDLMDAADRKAAKSDDENESNSSDQKSDVLEPDEIAEDTDGAMPAPPMNPIVFMASVELLGRVVRNSEFTDASDKLLAAKLHIRCSAQVMMLYWDIIKTLVEKLAEEREDGAFLTADDAEAVRYIVLKSFSISASIGVTEQIGTEKMFSVFDQIADDTETSTAERLLIGMMLLDLNHPKWLSTWEKLIVGAKGNRFTLDLLMDRLWQLLHTRPVTDAERKRIEAAAEKIEVAFGLPKHVRSEVTKNIRNAAKETARQESS